MNARAARSLAAWGWFGFAVLCAGLFVAPLVWLAGVAVSASAQSPGLLPAGVSFVHFQRLLAETPFVGWLMASLFLASASTVAGVLLSSLAGFALARYRFAGRRSVLLLMLGTLLLPGAALLPAAFELVVYLNLAGSYWAIFIPQAASVFGVLLFMQAFAGVPEDLLAAARIDGCPEWRLWWDVALPAVRPLTAAFTLLSFVFNYNAFLWPQVVLTDARRYTLPVGLNNWAGLAGYGQEWGLLAAGTLLAVLPVAVLFMLMQREFVAGLTSGAVKG
ncbi:MAG: carbohydrate ABC transporter permease [Phycisphaerae bacterium]